MTKRRGQAHTKLPLIYFIMTASCLASAVAGLGSFHIKVLSLELNPPPSKCSTGTLSPCKSNNTFCGNNSVVFTVCLSHHQLPLPHTLQCTFGEEVLTIPYVGDVNSNSDHWKPPRALMSVPFTFSWPGGFSLSLSASWDCHAQESTETFIFSNVVVADRIIPSRQWTSFINPRSSTGHTPYVRNSPAPHHTAVASSKLSSQFRTPGQNSHANTSIGSLSKIFLVNRPELTNHQTSSMEKSASEVSSRDEDFGVNSKATDNSQTSLKSSKILTEKEDILRTNIQWRSVSGVKAVTAVSGDDASTESDIHLLSTTAVVRLQGSSMVAAVRVVCMEHYFGNSCSNFCRPRDDLLGHYRCSESGQHVCLEGWSGADCTQAVCSESCVSSRGTCTSPNRCTCKHGWFGERCDRCKTYPGCTHGSCHLPGQCVCHKGWTGPLCDVEELFCLDHKPCQNGGTCLQDGFHNYTCNCPAGYTGTHCEVPLCHNNFCLNGGVCQIGEGTRYCLCQPSFAGPRCQLRLNHVDIKSLRTSCNGSACPYTSHHIQHQTLKLQSSCNDATCLSELLKPVSCQGHLCYNRGTCHLPPGSHVYECECPFPFAGNQCLQVRDPCQSNPCQNGAVCTTTDPVSRSFRCLCVLGYSGDLCDSDSRSSSKSNTACDDGLICQNGGICQMWQRSGQFFCKCSPEFTGEFCEIDNTNPCLAHVCLNGGTCVIAQNNEPLCVCEEGYTGQFCQNLPDSVCSRVVCQNGGTCIEHDGEFVCSCRKKFEGIFCEKRFRRRETALNVRLEMLTVKKDELETNVERSKSTSTLRRTQLLSFVVIVLGIWIVCKFTL